MNRRNGTLGARKYRKKKTEIGRGGRSSAIYDICSIFFCWGVFCVCVSYYRHITPIFLLVQPSSTSKIRTGNFLLRETNSVVAVKSSPLKQKVRIQNALRTRPQEENNLFPTRLCDRRDTCCEAQHNANLKSQRPNTRQRSSREKTCDRADRLQERQFSFLPIEATTWEKEKYRKNTPPPPPTTASIKTNTRE